MKLAFLLLIFGINSTAQVLVGSDAKQIKVNTTYLIDDQNTTDLKNLDLAAFKNYPKTSFDFRDSNAIWIKFDLVHKNLKKQKFTIGLSQSMHDYLHVYHIIGGDTLLLAFSNLPQNHRQGFFEGIANPHVRFDIVGHHHSTILLRLRDPNIIHFNVFIGEENLALAKLFSFERYTSIFLGFLIAFCVLSYLYYLVSRSIIYLYYAFYILFICFYFESILGNLYFLLPQIPALFTKPNSIALYGSAAISFIVLFLEKLFSFNENRRFRIFKAFVFVLLFVLFFANAFIDRVSSSLYIPLVLILVQTSILIFAWPSRTSTFYFYLISVLPLFMLCLVRIIALLGFIEAPHDLSSAIMPAVSFELFVLMFLQGKTFFETLKTKNAFRTQTIKNQLIIQETERKKIAEDLHDNLGSTLALLKDRVFEETQSPETHTLMLAAINGLRAVSNNLQPVAFELFGLIPSLEKLVAGLNQSQNVQITFISFNPQQSMSKGHELTIYRILEELLQNTAKQCANATLQLVFHPQMLNVSLVLDQTPSPSAPPLLDTPIRSRLAFLRAQLHQNPLEIMFEVPYN